ncbi:MAG TPA: tetraacyldisaccharide 4'-kinase [Thermoanaerobaculia bacterium]
MKAAEAIYTSVNGVRRWLYRRGALKSQRLPRPVVSIGNITAGGAGKTPAVIALANALTRRGIRVAVLTRGYGRSDTSFNGLMDTPDPDRFGDEPSLIKTKADKADVIVGVNRYMNAIDYLRRNDCDVFVLDDGFQHLQLHRDLDIVIDAPGSFHRERRSALRHAAIVIPRRLDVRIPEPVRGRRVFAFAGLANPQQFFDSLTHHGVDLRGQAAFADHHRYTDSDLAKIDTTARACGADVIATTEKDAVKIRRSDIIAVPAEFDLPAEVIDRAAALVRK